MNSLLLVLAQTAAAQPAPRTVNPWIFPAQIALIFGIFYFLMIRPQQKQRRKHEDTIRGLKKGDQVVTAGGIVGEVVHIAQATQEGQPVVGMGDHITIKSGDSRLIVTRGRIASVGGSPEAQ